MAAYPNPKPLHARLATQRRSSSSKPCIEYWPEKHQAPLCWGCFLPIFGNRPGMFDGDLSNYFTDDDERSMYENTPEHPAHYPTESLCCNLLSEHDTCGPQGVARIRETTSPLVTVPSPVSCHAEHIQETPTYNDTDAQESWEDFEPPELTFSDATSVNDPSSVNTTNSPHIDDAECSQAHTGDIINCNIVGGIQIQAVLHQAGMRIPFAATIPFPRADNAPFSGLEAHPLAKEQEVSVVGQLQVGVQKIPFGFSSAVE